MMIEENVKRSDEVNMDKELYESIEKIRERG